MTHRLAVQQPWVVMEQQQQLVMMRMGRKLCRCLLAVTQQQPWMWRTRFQAALQAPQRQQRQQQQAAQEPGVMLALASCTRSVRVLAAAAC